jgi:hypothetical protein
MYVKKNPRHTIYFSGKQIRLPEKLFLQSITYLNVLARHKAREGDRVPTSYHPQEDHEYVEDEAWLDWASALGLDSVVFAETTKIRIFLPQCK